jgi:hypothetical protein
MGKHPGHGREFLEHLEAAAFGDLRHIGVEHEGTALILGFGRDLHRDAGFQRHHLDDRALEVAHQHMAHGLCTSALAPLGLAELCARERDTDGQFVFRRGGIDLGETQERGCECDLQGAHTFLQWSRRYWAPAL